jgi:predicted alpha/beta superfamily hydrolase
MRKYSIIISVISILVLNNSYCQTLPNQIEINSKYVKDTKYVIDIILPPEYDSTHIYPVVYCVDNWLGSKFIPGMLYLLNFSQAIEPLIIVGIGNEGNINDWQMERTRDQTPIHISKYDMTSSNSPRNRGITGGADNFLLFIKNELIPLVESRYKSDTTKRGLFGYSYGGLFGVYALIRNPELFQIYYFGSPSLWYNDFALIDSLNIIPTEKLSTLKAVNISVGEKESSEQLKGFADLRDLLQEKNISSLKLTTHIFSGEDHRSAIIPAYYETFRCLFGKN